MVYLLENDLNGLEMVSFALEASNIEARGFSRPGEFWDAIKKINRS